MFGFRNWVKRMVQMKSGKDVVAKLQTHGVVSEKMREAQKLWSVMYDDTPPWKGERTKTLNLPASIASEVARLATVELQSEITGGKRAEFLSEMYQPILEKLRRYVEYGCAKGGLVFKPYVDGGKIMVDLIQGDCFFPTAFDSSGKMTGAVFVSQAKQDDKIYSRLEEHLIDAQGYHIINRAFVSRIKGQLGTEVPLSEISMWAHLAPQVLIENVHQLLIGYFKVPYANTVDSASPLGVSVYARACDLIREADKQYSRLLWEFESGERALYVSDMAFRLDKNGKAMIPDKRLYRLLEIEQGGNDLFSDWSPTLREENLLRGLNSILRKIEFNCGLAYGTLSDVDNVDKTAEEIKSSKQRSYTMINDVQKALGTALAELVSAMDILCSLYALAPEGTYSLSFSFDDSIMADRTVEFTEKRELVSDGIMQPWEFRMWYFGESEEQAKEALAGKMVPAAEPIDV